MIKIFGPNRGEIGTLVVVGLLVLVGAATLVTTTLNQDRKTTDTRASEACTYDSGVPIPLGQTETKSPPSGDVRWPISQHTHEYNVFGGAFTLVPNTNASIANLTFTDSGGVDGKITGVMGSMIGFKPKSVAPFDMKYSSSALQRADTAIKGLAPVLRVPLDPTNPVVKVPATGYDIGGGYEAMVVYADTNSVTLHIGRHEYFVGKCNDMNVCSGGYWIYVTGLCVDQQIQNAYNGVKGAQQAAGADNTPIQLPMVMAGHILGKALDGKSATIGIRDNGPFISTSKSEYWGGAPTRDLGIDNSGGTTNPTVAPTAPVASTPTPKPGITCGHPGLQCCNPANPDTASIGAACVSGSTCVNRECVAVTPTPTSSQATPTITPTPTSSPAECNGVTIDGAIFKYNDKNKISFFRVSHKRSNSYGPKVTFASSNGNKASTLHIDGPAWGESQWEPGKFGDIPFGKGQKKYFYLEIQLKTDDNRTVICAEKAVQCERTATSQADTEIACGAIARVGKTTERVEAEGYSDDGNIYIPIVQN